MNMGSDSESLSFAIEMKNSVLTRSRMLDVCSILINLHFLPTIPLLEFIENFQKYLFSFLCSDNILMSEEKQRILLLEQVRQHALPIAMQQEAVFCLYIFNPSIICFRLYT